MRNFIEILNEERFTEKVFIDGHKTLWVAYDDNSGTTSLNVDKGYLTDKSSDANYDSIVRNIVKFAKNTKPIKSKGNLSLYELPIYSGKEQKNYSIWDGTETPKKVKYFIVSTGKINVVTFFDTKKEALMWIKTTA